MREHHCTGQIRLSESAHETEILTRLAHPQLWSIEWKVSGALNYSLDQATCALTQVYWGRSLYRENKSVCLPFKLAVYRAYEWYNIKYSAVFLPRHWNWLHLLCYCDLFIFVFRSYLNYWKLPESELDRVSIRRWTTLLHLPRSLVEISLAKTAESFATTLCCNM